MYESIPCQGIRGQQRRVFAHSLCQRRTATI
jgi:hypothetical protein